MNRPNELLNSLTELTQEMQPKSELDDVITPHCY